MSGSENSYGSIVKSSSIVGGAHALTYIFGMVRVKVVAILLGPSGVGVVSIFLSLIELVGTATALGTSSSGVREIAQANGKGDPEHTARVAAGLKFTCWCAGFLGWFVTAILAAPLSRFFFNSGEHSLSVALLGVALVFNSLNGGFTALLQGVRRVGDIAQITVLATAANTIIAIVLYSLIGEAGIVPVLTVSAAVSMGITWMFARRVRLPPVELAFAEGLAVARRLVRLGSAFAWSAVLAAGLDIVTRGIIARSHGLDAAGLYQAAWSISGLFASFVLTAMGTDYFPRLTKVIDHPLEATKTVNEQSEVGMLLALPGMLGTLAFAPLIISLLYSTAFVLAAPLLPWFTLGVFARVVSWPMGYVLLARGEAGWFAGTQTFYVALQMLLIWLFVPSLGLLGAAYAFVLVYVLHILGMYLLARRFIGFRWSAAAGHIFLVGGVMLAIAFLITLMPPGAGKLTAGGVITLAGSMFSLIELVRRLGPEHRLSRMLQWARR